MVGSSATAAEHVAAVIAIKNDRRATIMTSSPIFTIGYGPRSLEQFIQVLRRYQVEYLLDVRSKPYSSFKPEFSREALAEALGTAGFRYIYMGDALGGQPDLPSCYTADGKVDYDAIRQKDFYQNGIARLNSAFQQGRRVALMCSEARPEMCHRTKLIGETLAAQGIDVAHIDEEDRIIDQAAAMLRLSGGQLGFSGWLDDGLTSRKKYRPTEQSEDGSEK